MEGAVTIESSIFLVAPFALIVTNQILSFKKLASILLLCADTLFLLSFHPRIYKEFNLKQNIHKTRTEQPPEKKRQNSLDDYQAPPNQI
jgi:hypothetical protein